MGSACSQVDAARPGDGMRSSYNAMKRSVSISLKKDFEDRYEAGDAIGADGDVVAVTNNETQLEYVVRTLQRNEMPVKDSGSLEEHLHALSGLDHNHICRFIEAFDSGSQIKLVYEKAKATTIFEHEDLAEGRPLAPEIVQVYCRQIAMGLCVAHRQGVVHGRLRESSLLIDPSAPEDEEDRSLKICDMGQTYILRKPRSITGRMQCEAPENLLEELPMPSSSSKFRSDLRTYASADMWALGVILYRMLMGRAPFAGNRKEDVRSAIQSSEIDFGPEWAGMEDVKHVVSSLLRSTARIRMTAGQVLRQSWCTLSKAKVSKSKMIRVLQNVIFNTTETSFKKFAMRVIAEDMAPEKLEVVQKVFRSIDKNGDGTLELEEIRTALRRYGEEDGAADEIFEAIDRDASGTLNFAEFMAVSIGPQEYCDRETLWHTFNRFDRDGNGVFDRSEITTVAREVEFLTEGMNVEKEVEAIAKDVDMPMDFDTFLYTMLTPAGRPINGMGRGFDRFCYSVFKVDNHKVRHITPKTFETGPSQLCRSPYAQAAGLDFVSSQDGASKEPSQRRSRRQSKSKEKT